MGTMSTEILLDPITKAANTQIPEIPHMGDPFMEMLYVIHVVMPAALKQKENDLASLGANLERLSDYQNLLTNSQDLMNRIKGADHGSIEQMAGDLLRTLKDLRNLVDLEDVIDGSREQEGSLKNEVLTSLDRFISEAEAGGPGQVTPGQYFRSMYEQSSTRDLEDDVTVASGYRSEYKARLDDINIVSSSFKSTSSQTQSLFDYDAQDYKTWVGLMDNMFQEFYSQVDAPIRGS